MKRGNKKHWCDPSTIRGKNGIFWLVLILCLYEEAPLWERRRQQRNKQFLPCEGTESSVILYLILHLCAPYTVCSSPVVFLLRWESPGDIQSMNFPHRDDCKHTDTQLEEKIHFGFECLLQAGKEETPLIYSEVEQQCSTEPEYQVCSVFRDADEDQYLCRAC